MRDRIASTPAHEAALLTAEPLPWGSLEAVQQLRALHGPPNLILCSDLIYFNELFAPLLRTLLWLTEVTSDENARPQAQNAPQTLVIAYKTRSLAREEVFFKAFCASDPATDPHIQIWLSVD